MTSVIRVAAPLASASVGYTRPLDAESDIEFVGGKAHALGRAMRAGLRVPAGFAIVTHALDEHLDTNGLRARIDALSARVDPNDRDGVAECGRQIRGLVVNTPLSDALREELFANAETLLACGAVVVRSSAVGEDSLGQSFAGQLDSILHVTNLSSLERAVLGCWASFWSDRALFYRMARNAPSGGMGVVVQQQINARAAGVLFTEAGDGTMLVEYTAGLADALVNGSIDPGRLSIDRRTGAVRHLAAADAFTLDASFVNALAAIAAQLEHEFGSPQDVEWVLAEDNSMWVVQSRPITAPIAASRPAHPASAVPPPPPSRARIHI
jgi:phosphoenolpyruvate synthase/pyruvate phosphate dikinase